MRLSRPAIYGRPMARGSEVGSAAPLAVPDRASGNAVTVGFQCGVGALPVVPDVTQDRA